MNPTLKAVYAEPGVRPLYVQVSVRVPEPLRRRAKIIAAKHNITLSQMLVHGLGMMLGELESSLAQTLATIKSDDPLALDEE